MIKLAKIEESRLANHTSVLIDLHDGARMCIVKYTKNDDVFFNCCILKDKRRELELTDLTEPYFVITDISHNRNVDFLDKFTRG